MQPVTDKPTSAERPEEDVIARAVRDLQRSRNREESFRVLVERYLPVVEGYLRRRVARPQDQEDLTQEVFLRVYKGVADFRGDSSFGTWLFTIARNTCHQWRRRRRARPEAALNSLVPRPLREDGEDAEPEIEDHGQPAPVEVVLDEEQRRLLRETIADLPPQMRRAMVLRVIHGLKYREIAELMQLLSLIHI